MPSNFKHFNQLERNKNHSYRSLRLNKLLIKAFQNSCLIVSIRTAFSFNIFIMLLRETILDLFSVKQNFNLLNYIIIKMLVYIMLRELWGRSQ